MPADCEYLLSVSPPIFSTMTYRSFADCDPFESFGHAFRKSQQTKLKDLNFYNNQLSRLTLPSPLRSCLIVRSEDLNNLRNSAVGRGKKRVVFADDKGFSLTSVKFVREPTDCPPRWDDSFLEQVTKGVNAEVSPKADIWEPDFVQPAANYFEFRIKLDSNCVSLENVIVKEQDDGKQLITGTVKVKNVDFHKNVSVRCSFDQWENFEDFRCDFVPSSIDPALSSPNCHDLYDTFSFSVPIADKIYPECKAIEFCVRFLTDAQEYWDNNENKNYRLVIKNSDNSGHNEKSDVPVRFEDALTADISSWTDFASWQHLINDTPYW